MFFFKLTPAVPEDAHQQVNTITSLTLILRVILAHGEFPRDPIHPLISREHDAY